MAKDSFWFKHDAGSGRGLRMLKMTHIHSHWGKGIYWDVIEVLRSQEGYKFERDESSLGLLAALIGADKTKFISWFNDCISEGINLFQTDKKYFWSDVLLENMAIWETKKTNGNQGGRPRNNRNETEPITGTKPKVKANQNHNRREEKSIEDKTIKEIDNMNLLFETFREMYPGRKRGHETELKALQKHEDWREVVYLLPEVIEKQIAHHAALKARGGFVPDWKDLKSWIHNRYWEEVIPEAVKATTPIPTERDDSW